MSSNPLVSIIVPVYKVEKYLDRCIQSVIRQTYKQWELILIDDGSPDKSGEICDVWAKKDDRIRVYHKENGGVSSARNLGLKQMKGDYLTFLDSDDWLDDTCLQTCLEVSLSNNLDVLQFSWSNVKSDGTSIIHNRKETFVCDAKEFAEFGELSVGMCGGFYNATIVRDNSICFDESMAYAEDQLFVFKCLNSSKKVKAIESPLYYYYQNSDSAIRNPNTEKLVNSCIAFSRYKKEVGPYASYIDVHNMYKVTELVANERLPQKEIKSFYESLNIEKDNIKNKNHRLFIILSEISFDLAVFGIKFYRKHILK